MMVLVTGGSGSGKSAFAENLLVSKSEGRRLYIATMIAWDEECRERIRKHRKMREKKAFETVERPMDLDTLSLEPGCAVLLECMSNLAANEYFRQDRPAEMAKERILSGIRTLKEQASFFCVVTNEIFGDGEEYGAETGGYRRLLGDLNRETALLADEVYEVCSGIAVKLKGVTGVDERVHMERTEKGALLIGGMYQGKTALALRMAGAGAMAGTYTLAEAGVTAGTGASRASVSVSDGRRDPRNSAFLAAAVLNFEEFLRPIVREAGDPLAEALAFTEEFLEKNPGAVVTANEIGCGIVPIQEKDRLWRDVTGACLQRLAAEKGSVYRVICGLTQTLKEEKGAKARPAASRSEENPACGDRRKKGGSDDGI